VTITLSPAKPWPVSTQRSEARILKSVFRNAFFDLVQGFNPTIRGEDTEITESVLDMLDVTMFQPNDPRRGY